MTQMLIDRLAVKCWSVSQSVLHRVSGPPPGLVLVQLTCNEPD